MGYLTRISRVVGLWTMLFMVIGGLVSWISRMGLVLRVVN